jgi:hypothetical protein
MSYSNFQFARKQDYELHKTTVDATYTVKTGTATYKGLFDNPVVIDGPAAAVTLTVPDGEYIGQTLMISSQDPNSQTITVSVTHHVTSDPETFTMSTADQWLLLMWTGTEWATVAGDATAT